MLRLLSLVICDHHRTTFLVLDDLHAPSHSFFVETAATDADSLDVDLSMLVLAVKLQVAIHLVVNLILVLIVIKRKLVALDFDTLHIDTVLDVAPFPDSLDLSIDQGALICRHTTLSILASARRSLSERICWLLWLDLFFRDLR